MENPKAIERFLALTLIGVAVVCLAAAIFTGDMMPVLLLIGMVAAFAGICVAWLCLGVAIWAPVFALFAWITGRQSRLNAEPLEPDEDHPEGKRLQKVLSWLSLLAILVLLGVFWRPIAVHVYSFFTAWSFADEFDSSRSRFICKHPDDWAWQFGGMAGLPHLKSLSEDDDLSPSGRSFARNLHDRISNGRHLPGVHMMVELDRQNKSSNTPWLHAVIVKYVYEHDKKALNWTPPPAPSKSPPAASFALP